MTRHDPAEAGPCEQVGACPEDTAQPSELSSLRGAVVRLGDDLERVAVDVIERLGPRRAGALAEHLVNLSREVPA